MNYIENSDRTFQNNEALTFVLRNQIMRILFFLAISIATFGFLFYFLNEANIRPYECTLIFFLFFLYLFRVENIRVLTLFKSIWLLSLVEKKDIKWNIQDDELTFGKGSYSSSGYVRYPVKVLVCFFDNKVEIVKPFVDYQTTNLVPFEV